MIVKRFLLDEKSINYLPLYFFTTLLRDFSSSLSFRKLCFDSNLHVFLAETCLFNSNFSIDCFSDDDFELNFGRNIIIRRYEIYFDWIYCFKTFTDGRNYCNDSLFKKIKERVTLFKNSIHNPFVYEAFLRLSSILLLIIYRPECSKVFIDIDTWDIIFNKLEQTSNKPRDMQMTNNREITMSFSFIKEIALRKPILPAFLESKNTLLRFLEKFHSFYHKSIIDCIDIFSLQEYFNEIQDNDEFFTIVKKLDLSNYDNYVKNKLKKLIIMGNSQTSPSCYDIPYFQLDKHRNDETGKKKFITKIK